MYLTYRGTPRLFTRAETIARTVFTFKFLTKGDQFATVQEMASIIDDPMDGPMSRAEFAAVEGMAFRDLRHTVRPETGRQVRAFLRAFFQIVQRDEEGHAADEGFGYTPDRKPRPYQDDPRVQALLERLNLPLPNLLRVLSVWTELLIASKPGIYDAPDYLMAETLLLKAEGR